MQRYAQREVARPGWRVSALGTLLATIVLTACGGARPVSPPAAPPLQQCTPPTSAGASFRAEAGGAPRNAQQAGALLFSSNWSALTGTSDSALSDGGKWNTLYGPGRATTLTVVPGNTVGWAKTPNVLRLQLRGPNVSGVLERTNAIPLSATHYGRFYFRNDETQVTSLHVVTYEPVGAIQVPIWVRKGTPEGISPAIQTLFNPLGLTQPWPYAYWRPGGNRKFTYLPNGQWFRYEWMMEYVTPITYRIWPRVYDLAGTLLCDASNYYTSEYESGLYLTSLKQFYDGGGMFGFSNVGVARDFGVGNEGPGGSVASMGYFYLADVALSLAGWIGP